MLRKNKNSRVTSAPLSEPQPLSTDEFRLQEMERREDAERGDDVRNADTFGADACVGWSFEEQLAANERIAERERMAAAASARERAFAMALAAVQQGYSGAGLQRNGAFSPGFEADTIQGNFDDFRRGPRPEVPRRSPVQEGTGLRPEPRAAQSPGPAPTQIPLPQWAAPRGTARSRLIQDARPHHSRYQDGFAVGADGSVPMPALQPPIRRTTLAPPWVQTSQRMELPQADLQQMPALATSLAKLAGNAGLLGYAGERLTSSAGITGAPTGFAGRAPYSAPQVRRYGGYDLPDPSREDYMW